jgi:1,4-dihydroxy-2-naphthoate octaprenyltransferase
VFQGVVIFFITYHGAHSGQTLNVPLLPCVISSLLIGALYPLTQIYQHEEDKKDGVTTISYLLGKKGTFVLSMILFLSATTLMYFLFSKKEQLIFFYLFLAMLLPVVLFFLHWMKKVWQVEEEANFKNSLMMNILSTSCTTAFFVTIIMLKH